MITEADTCRKYVLPKLYAAGWNDDQISEQKTFTDGRIVVVGEKCFRKKQKRADYLLRFRRDFTIAVVEAKSAYKNPADGLQQAKEYAEILGLKFAYATNGKGIIEHDYITGNDADLAGFPTPDELWARLSRAEGVTPELAERLLQPCNTLPGKIPRYYQEIAINRAVKSVLQGKKRILLNLATGTGKTYIAFQIIWKLWNSRWNRTGEHRRPKVLYLADRNVLVDDPKDKPLPLSVMPGGRFRVRQSRAGRYISLFIRQLQKTSDAPVFINNMLRISLISLSLMNVTGEAQKTKATGVKYWNILNRHTKSG